MHGVPPPRHLRGQIRGNALYLTATLQLHIISEHMTENRPPSEHLISSYDEF